MKKSEFKNIISEEIRVALVSELVSEPVSGTKAGAVKKLAHRVYQLTSDIEKAKMSERDYGYGGYIIDLPEGSIVYNLPGGLIVDHPSFKENPMLKRGYMDKSTYAGLAIVQDPNILQQIEENGIVLGDEKKKYEVSLEEVYSEKQRKWACAQDEPKFDEMCKDTAISKKKVKEAILKALKNG